LHLIAVGADCPNDEVAYRLQCDKIHIILKAIARRFASLAIRAKPRLEPQLMVQIEVRLRQIGAQRVYRGIEVGGIRQIPWRTLTGCGADQTHHGHEQDGGSPYCNLISGVSAHAVILSSPASIVDA
jgi:hypothetical protein